MKPMLRFLENLGISMGLRVLVQVAPLVPQKSEIVKALQTPECVELLDQINCISNPTVLNSLFSLTDKRRYANFEELGTVRIADGLTIWSTQNDSSSCTGPGLTHSSLLDRYSINMEINYLAAEKKPKYWSSVARLARDWPNN